jgi:uncharacterized protein
MNERIAEIVSTLGLIPHPERGYYFETYRAKAMVTAETHPGPRSASTAVYYLTTDEAPATYLHRLLSDEVFHLYEGGPLDVIRLMPDGSHDVVRLGRNFALGERPQIVIPAGTWFGTELLPGVSYCLIGCTVAPGFEFQDFELAEGPELRERYPELGERIFRMTRPAG